MAEIQETNMAISNLQETLKELPDNMRFFSLSMRALYGELAVGTNEKTCRDFRRLRDRTRNDAMVYLRGILPIATNFIRCTSQNFRFYEALSFEQWVSMIHEIHEETLNCKYVCEIVVKMHEEILATLKKRRDEAKLIISESEELQEKFTALSYEMDDTAGVKRGFAKFFLFLPFINLIVCPLLLKSAQLDEASAVAKRNQARIVEESAIVVSEALIPALENFIEGITKVARFFSVMEHELREMEATVAAGREGNSRLYYLTMRNNAEGVRRMCQAFYAVLPEVKSDFLAIPTQGTDQNYVDRWLERQRQIIREKTKTTLAAELLKSITG